MFKYLILMAAMASILISCRSEQEIEKASIRYICLDGVVYMYTVRRTGVSSYSPVFMDTEEPRLQLCEDR